jgi:hypothetical protein
LADVFQLLDGTAADRAEVEEDFAERADRTGVFFHRECFSQRPH